MHRCGQVGRIEATSSIYNCCLSSAKVTAPKDKRACSCCVTSSVQRHSLSFAPGNYVPCCSTSYTTTHTPPLIPDKNEYDSTLNGKQDCFLLKKPPEADTAHTSNISLYNSAIPEGCEYCSSYKEIVKKRSIPDKLLNRESLPLTDYSCDPPISSEEAWIPLLHSKTTTLWSKTSLLSFGHKPYRGTSLLHLFYTSVFLLTVCIHSTLSNMMCPVPEPCYCIGNDVIYCAYKRLTSLPYFLDFFDVWDQLNLSDNLLHSIPAKGFTTPPQHNGIKVRTLDLSRNIISKMDVDSFVGIEYLYVLDLSHNQMSNIPKMLLAPLYQLNTLKLRYNRFRGINSDAFQKVPHLIELDLSGNDLTSVPSDALVPLISLKKLWLRNNKLKVIGGFAFPDIPLELLDLGENDSPVRMEAKALCGLRPKISHAEPNVKEWSGIHTLFMDHNGLSHLDPCVTKLLWTLQKVHIGGNPLRCDCRLYLLKVWGIRTTFPNAQCATPIRFASEYVDKLDQHKFNCTRTDTTQRCKDMCPEPTPSPNMATPAVINAANFLFLISLLVLLS